MTRCEICAILAYQNEHLEACTARYDFILYITQTQGHRNKSAVCNCKQPVNKDICTGSVMIHIWTVWMWQYIFICVCVAGGHSLVSSSRSAPAVELCNPSGSVERGLHLCWDVPKKVSKAYQVKPLHFAPTHTLFTLKLTCPTVLQMGMRLSDADMDFRAYSVHFDWTEQVAPRWPDCSVWPPALTVATFKKNRDSTYSESDLWPELENQFSEVNDYTVYCLLSSVNSVYLLRRHFKIF